MTDDSTAGKVMARAEHLQAFCTGVLRKLGVPPEEADVTADTMVKANLRGVDTHGVMRMPLYSAKLKAGLVATRVELVPVRETLATAVLDGQNGLGQVVGYRAMQVAIRKARETGVSWVAVRNSNHFGACAYYSMMALPHDMIGFAATNASPRLAPWGGVEKMLGNNPWSYAIPTGKHPSFVLDMANSIVAVGKVRIAAKEGKSIPEGWALNRYGEPTTDPQEALQGIMLAIGGYKGYGITLTMDMITGVLADSAFGPRVKGLDTLSGLTRTGHTFMAVDISAFGDVDAFKARVDSYIDELKASQKARGVDEILVPGEPESRKGQTRLRDGIPLQPKVAEELRALAVEYGVPLEM